MATVFSIVLTLTLLSWCRVGHAQQWGAGQPQAFGMPQAQPWGMPQMRQRMNLEYGICTSPMVITVCIEGSMARDKYEFRHMLNFTGLLVSALYNLQPRQIATAINYCSYVKDWTPWTTSKQAFVRELEALEWPYHFRPGSSTARYGAYPGTGGGYGAFSPLQPNSGLCLERARQAFAQVPPYYQRLLIHFTSGRSSNPLLAMQHAQAAMYEGTEIFAISLDSYGLSEELRMSISGYQYLMQISSLNALSRRHLDHVIENVCRVEREPVRDSPKDPQSGRSNAAGVNNAETPSNAPDDDNQGAVVNPNSIFRNNGRDGANGVENDNTDQGRPVSSTGNRAGTGIDNRETGGAGTNSGGGVEIGSGVPRQTGVGNGGTVIVTGGGSSNNGGGVGGIVRNNDGAGSTGTGVGGESGGSGRVGSGGTSGRLGGVGTSNGGIGSGTGGGRTSRRLNRRRGNNNGGFRATRRPVIGSNDELGNETTGVGGGRGNGNAGGGIGVGGGGRIGGAGGGSGNGGLGGLGGGVGGLGRGTGGVGTGGGLGGGTGNGGTGGAVGIGGGSGGFGGASNNGGVGGLGNGLGGIGGGTGNGGGGLGTGNNAGGSGGGTGTGSGGGNVFNINDLFSGLQSPDSRSSTLCVPVGFISNPFLRQMYLAGRKPCPIVTMRPLPTIRPAGCIDVSNVANDIERQAMMLLNFPRPACPLATQRAPIATVATSATEASSNTDSTNSPSTAGITVVPATTTPITVLTCIDLDIFSPPERPGAVIVLSLYDIPTCPLDSSNSGSGSINSTGCFDVSVFLDEQREIVTRIIQPLSACNENTEPTVSSPVNQNATVACVNISTVIDSERQTAVDFITSRELVPCSIVSDPVSTTTESSCVDISIYTTPEDRARAIEFFELYNITICPYNATDDTVSTASLATCQELCIDVSIFPVHEQPGAVVFLTLYGIAVCPIDTSSSGPTASSCVDISGYTEEQREVIVTVVERSAICNESLSNAAIESIILNNTLTCINVSEVNETQRDVALEFLASRGLVACGVSVSTTTATTEENCVDVSIYTDPAERQSAIEYLTLYNIPICPINTTDNQQSTLVPVTNSLPCVDVSIFPVNEQPGAVVFLSLYGILACPLGNSSSGANGTSSAECVDLSGFTEEQKVVIVEIIKPYAPCQESSQSAVSNSLVQNITVTCVNITGLSDFDKEKAMEFMKSHGLSACDFIMSTPLPVTTKTSCVDISGYATPQDRQDAIEFFELYNIAICPESSASETATTASPLCIDVSIFPSNEQSGAVVFLSLYGIPACPLSNTDTATGDAKSEGCVDISKFTEEQKAVITEIIKPFSPCNETSEFTAVNIESESAEKFCVNLTTVDNTVREIVVEFMVSRIIPACGVSATVETTPSTQDLPCIDISMFPENEQSGAAIFLSIYGLTACPFNSSVSQDSTANYTKCIDVSKFSADQKAIILEIMKPTPACNETTTDEMTTPMSSITGQSGLDSASSATASPNCIDLSSYTDPQEKASAVAFFQLYNYQVCPEPTLPSTEIVSDAPRLGTTSNPSGRGSIFLPSESEPCLDVSIFPEHERANAVVFLSIYRIVACPLTNSTSNIQNCIDLSGFTEARRAVIVEMIKPAQPCNESTTSTPTQAVTSSAELGVSQTEAEGTTGTISTTEAPCVNISSYDPAERAMAIEFFKEFGISPCEEISITVAPTQEQTCVDLSGVVPALRQFVLAMNAPLEACEEGVSGISIRRAIVSKDTAAAARPPPTSSSADLCRYCKTGPDAVCYNRDPDSCSNYLVCTIVKERSSMYWSHRAVSCPPGTLWSQDTLSCGPPEDSACFKENCTPGRERDILYLPSCPQYLRCDSSGTVTRQCCPLGQVFVNGACQSGILPRCKDFCL